MVVEISAQAVQQLREKTGLGLMQCKKALTETAGDLEKAVEFLRKQGAAVAAKRVGRETKEGKIVFASVGSNVAVLEVEDNGKGISPDVQKRLFDPFYTTKAAGTGLGLSIAARIIEQHGGALRYKTEIGRGTTFGIVLPLKSSDEK